MTAYESGSSDPALPWLSIAEKQSELTDVTPGEYVLRSLFFELTVLTDRKLEQVLAEPLEKPLSKSLQRGEDPQFDQVINSRQFYLSKLLSSLNAVAQYSLTSLLKILFEWYVKLKTVNQGTDTTDGPKNKNGSKSKNSSPDSPKLATMAKLSGKEMDYLTERRDHAVDFLFCLVLIDVLKQLPVHPVDDSLINHIENLAFKCFKQRNSFGDGASTTNAYIIAALYAEVIGVLAQTRFHSVRKRFLAEFKENSGSTEMLVNVIFGMKYLRIKLYPVEHLEETFMFLQDCANVFIETRDKDVKYALAAVLVEILVPVAATAKRELQIPALKNFIEMLYPSALEMSKKTKHVHAMYPLVAVLLCVSQKQYFLTHWPFLLSSCLANIKHRDTKMQRICLECLYRMLWVYVIRIKGENNTTTLSRLRSVTDTLFPRGSRIVNPRDIPLTIFVKIVHFISHYNLDFAMQDIIFDLLSVGRQFRQLHPERMNIGLRAFLVIVDSLQKKEGDPAMPNTTGTLPSGSSLRVKKSFLNKPLTEDAAKDLGIGKYYHSVCKALTSILNNLDLQVGRPMMKNNPQCSNKESYDMITGERKPKIDLFRTSVASIPRLIPSGMRKSEVVGLLSRLTIHVDEELRSLSFSSLQSLIIEFVEWREEVIVGFVNFIMREVQDYHASLLDGSLRMVLKMLTQWKTLITMCESERKGTFQQADITIPMTAIHCIEGCGLAMLCSVRQVPRKLALLLLKEARILGNLVSKTGNEKFVMDVVDDISSDVLSRTLKNISPDDKSLFGSSVNVDLQWFVDKLPSGFDTETGESGDPHHNDLWCSVLSQLLVKHYIPDLCPVATQFGWQSVHARLFCVYSLIDQSPSGMDSLTSLGSVYSRSTKKVFNLSDVCLWQNYLMFACTVHPTSAFELLPSDNENGNSSDEGKSEPRPSSPDRVESLFRFAVTLVRNDSSEIRNAVITCLGNVSPDSYKEFVEELQVSLLQYVLEKRAERKRKKRDNIRTYLARIFELNAEHGCFRECSTVLSDEGALSSIFVDYIENTRSYFGSGEADKDPSAVHQLKLNFARFIHKMIKSIPFSVLCKGKLLSIEVRAKLFSLLCSWCSTTDVSLTEKMNLLAPDKRTELEIAAIQGLCSVLCCGPVFDRCGLSNDGYFFKWIEYVLSTRELKLNYVGQETVELLLDLNEGIPSLLEWVINKCYTGTKTISNTCFHALTAVMIRRSYPCKAIPVIGVVLFKTFSADPNERERAAQLLQLLERRFLSYCLPGLAKYSQSPHELSVRFANYHPELTIPLLAELTYRFETAPFTFQRTILKFMHPWLCNVQLVDIAANRTTHNGHNLAKFGDEVSDENLLPHVEMTGDGWGSSKATQLVLNNLFFLTVKYAHDFNSEFEELWSALSNAWIGNNHEILNYLNILAGIGAHPDFLPHAKRLAVYLVRANKEGTIKTLMEELQLTEPVAHQFERSDEAPFYSFISKDRSFSLLADNEENKNTENNSKHKIDEVNDVVLVDTSKIDIRVELVEQNGSTSSDPDSCIDCEERSSVPVISPVPNTFCEEITWAKQWIISVHGVRRKTLSGVPLPTPSPDLYFASLVDVLPSPQMITPLYRCNFALILLSEIVADQPSVKWLPHLPLMLHAVFLGLDHSKALIHEHCKSLLINLAIIMVLQGNYSSIANSLLMFNYVTKHGLNISGYPSVPRNLTDLSLMVNPVSNISLGSTSTNTNQNSENNLVLEEKVKWLIWYLTQSEGKQLWSFEDITARCHEIRSATELSEFLLQVLELFDQKFPDSDIRGNWVQVASKWAISCSSRHYAGRSFQVLRALSVQLSWSVISDILSRLAESIGDSNEDVQGYVMEILLTLDSVVQRTSEQENVKVITSRFPEIGDVDENDDENDNNEILATSSPERDFNPLSMKKSVNAIRHIRSLSSGCDLRGRFRQYLKQGEELSPRMRSTSLQSLRLSNDNSTTLSKSDLLSRIFWVAVSMLESDYEHEFVMAVKLLTKVLKLMDLTQKGTLERLESLFYKLKWFQFPGVQTLLLKGLTSSTTSGVTIELIKKLTPYSTLTIMDASESTGLALNILAILPYMVQRFSEPGDFCLSCASTIGQVCVNNNMANLGKLFAMYNQRTYHKTVEKWTKAVCQYIFEFYRQSIRTLLAFLTELLERGPQVNQTAVLNITCGLMKHIDFKLLNSRHILIPTLKVITKHIKDDLWKESLSVLKLAVASSSQLEVPVHKTTSVLYDSTWSLDNSATRSELPGKTLDFTFDLSSPTIVSSQENQEFHPKNQPETTGWKRPQLSQRRTKERLVSVLHVCGHHIGLKQSPSVVFSSSSDLMAEKLTSDHSSSDENQLIEGDSKEGEETNEAQQLIGVFTDFDFLDDEIDDHDDEISGFGWDHPTAEYSTTPEPAERSRTSPLSGSEPDIIAACRVDTDTDEEEEPISRSLNTTASPCITVPLTEEALRAHDETEGFSPVREFTPPSESSNESLDLHPSHLPRVVTSLLDNEGIDEQWRGHVSALVNDTSGSQAVNTFTLLALLFRHIRRKVNELTRECCTTLDNSLFGVTSLFLEILETLDSQGNCPYVFLDTDTVRRSKILEKQKFMALEIDDHYRSYKITYENTRRVLERLKITPKPLSEYPSSNEGELVTTENSIYEGHEISLCWTLYKLHFQVLLFLDSYARLFEHLQKQCHKAEITDQTSRVTAVRDEIVSTLPSLRRSSPDPFQDIESDDSHTCQSIIESIMRNVHASNIEFAIKTFYVFRDKLNLRSGFLDLDDTELIVTLYARYLVEKKVGTLAMSKPEFTLSSVSSELKEMTIHLLSVIEQLTPTD